MTDAVRWSHDALLEYDEEGVSTFVPVTTRDAFKMSPRKSHLPWPAELDRADSDGKFVVYTSLKPNAYTQSLTLITDWSAERPK